jgi:hypothetical protein
MPDRWERIQSVFKKPTQNARFIATFNPFVYNLLAVLLQQ